MRRTERQRTLGGPRHTGEHRLQCHCAKTATSALEKVTSIQTMLVGDLFFGLHGRPRTFHRAVHWASTLFSQLFMPALTTELRFRPDFGNAGLPLVGLFTWQY
jgi:hypothetical protein